MQPIAYKLFDLRGRNPQRGRVLGPTLKPFDEEATDANDIAITQGFYSLALGARTCSRSSGHGLVDTAADPIV